MKLKPAILAVLGREALKGIVDDLGIGGVDRRSVDAMRRALSRRVKPEVLVEYLYKDELQAFSSGGIAGQPIAEAPSTASSGRFFTTRILLHPLSGSQG